MSATRLSWSAALVLSLFALAPARADDPRPGAAVEQARLFDSLRALPTKRAVLGDIEHQQGLIETERHLVKALKDIGYEPTLEPLTWNIKRQNEASKDLPGAAPDAGAPETTPGLAANTWHNIIVEIPGTESPKEVLLVGAHFDAVPGTPGADDNGTGVAALLELARVLKDRPVRRTVRLVFFNLEEIRVRGSTEHLAGLRPKLTSGSQRLVGMISLEMLGYFTDEPDSQRSPIPKIEGVFDPPTVGDFIAIVTVKRHQPFSQRLLREMSKAAPDLKVAAADFAPIAPPDFLRSDHGPFLMAGYPAVMVTDTSNFRNPNYHRPSDTIDTLDPRRYTAVVRALAEAVYEIANSPPEAAPAPTAPAGTAPGSAR